MSDSPNGGYAAARQAVQPKGEGVLKRFAALVVVAAALAAPDLASADEYAWTVASPEQEYVLEAVIGADVAVGDTVTLDSAEYQSLADQFGW